MTAEYRNWLRNEIDTAKRARLQRARLGDTTNSRREYWREYHTTNRDHILAKRAAKAAT